MDNDTKIDELLYGKVKDKKDQCETWVERNKQIRRERRENILKLRVPDRCCCVCNSVKLRSKAWVTISDARSALLERQSKCLEQRKVDLNRDEKANPTTLNTTIRGSWRLEKYCSIERSIAEIAKVQQVKAVCRGCWIKLSNKFVETSC